MKFHIIKVILYFVFIERIKERLYKAKKEGKEKSIKRDYLIIIKYYIRIKCCTNKWRTRETRVLC